MLCLIVSIVGIVNLFSMPVDLFPDIDMPVVVVATFYSGMPPQQIEADITNTFERFFTLAANVDHSESRSLTGVSLIKIYFKPGTDPNAALSNVSNLAMADLRRLPPGTLPPVVLGLTASTQPVCLVTLEGKGLNETQLKDLAQFQVRNQISNVQGASVPQPYGGTYRQIQVYVDPLKMEARNLSLQDVVQAVNSSNLILPAGDVRIGSKDFNIYANSQFPGRPVDEPDAAQVRRQRLRPCRRHRPRRRLRSTPVQHRPHRRPAFRLRARFQAGRQQQHHHHRRRHEAGHQTPCRHSVLAQNRRRLRSVSLRQAGPQAACQRGRHRPRTHRHHDPALPRQPSRHSGRHVGGSPVGPGVHAHGQHDGRHHQHHDPRWPRPRLLPPHR